MADVYICAFSRVIDWNGLKSVLQMLEPKDIAEVTHRVEICSRTRGCVLMLTWLRYMQIGRLNLFDQVSAVGYHELDLSDPEDRVVAQELVRLAVEEPGLVRLFSRSCK